MFAEANDCFSFSLCLVLTVVGGLDHLTALCTVHVTNLFWLELVENLGGKAVNYCRGGCVCNCCL